jgi:hypothetical protein
LLKTLIHGGFFSDNRIMKRIIFFVILTLFAGLNLSAQRVWEGTVVAGRYGDFPPAGYYGTSNIFPRNSLVNVQNIANGKIVQIIISGGLEDPAFFLVLSRQASDALGLDRNDTANVRVSLALTSGDPIVQGVSDLPYSNDPEINPAAKAGDVNSGMEKKSLPPDYVPYVPVEPPPPMTYRPLEPEPPKVPETPPQAVYESPAAEESPSISSRFSASGDTVFVITESPFAELPEEKPAISDRRAAEKTPGSMDEWTIVEDPAPKIMPIPAPVPVMPPPAPVPQRAPVPQPARGGEAPKMETVITLEPAKPRPPDEDAASLDSIIAEISEASSSGASPSGANAEWARENLPLVASLPAKSYYLQVASHRNPESVKPVVDALKTAYPVYPVVVLSGGGDPLYRVMVGPIKEDERGVVLRHIRAKGYRDAFLKEN